MLSIEISTFIYLSESYNTLSKSVKFKLLSKIKFDSSHKCETYMEPK